jgi:hypothetical protein
MCDTQRIGFAGLISDNDEVYLQNLIGVCDSVDELACMSISKTPHSMNFRIAPSTSQYLEPLLKEILKLNNMFGIRITMSKSMKSSCVINFSIES